MKEYESFNEWAVISLCYQYYRVSNLTGHFAPCPLRKKRLGFDNNQKESENIIKD